MADMELLDGVSAEQLFRGEDSNGLTFDDIIAMVRVCAAPAGVGAVSNPSLDC